MSLESFQLRFTFISVLTWLLLIITHLRYFISTARNLVLICPDNTRLYLYIIQYYLYKNNYIYCKLCFHCYFLLSNEWIIQRVLQFVRISDLLFSSTSFPSILFVFISGYLNVSICFEIQLESLWSFPYFSFPNIYFKVFFCKILMFHSSFLMSYVDD